MKGELKICKIIDFLKSELEHNFDVKESLLFKLDPDMPGNYALKFKFEGKQGLWVDIDYWDAGTLVFGANFGEETKNLMIDLFYTPENIYEDNGYTYITYPKDSEHLFIEKVNELLGILNSKYPNVKPKLPDELN